MRDGPTEDYYVLLGVDRTATAAELRRSYRLLALRYHPDRAGPQGTETFQRIARAYAMLSDARSRLAYDGPSARAEPPPPGHRTEPRGEHNGAGGRFGWRVSRRAAADRDLLLRLSGRLEDLLARGIARHAGDGAIELLITRAEAMSGGTAIVDASVPVPCPTCGGIAQRYVLWCRRCEYAGAVVDQVTFRFQIPAWAADGTCFFTSDPTGSSRPAPAPPHPLNAPHLRPLLAGARGATFLRLSACRSAALGRGVPALQDRHLRAEGGDLFGQEAAQGGRVAQGGQGGAAPRGRGRARAASGRASSRTASSSSGTRARPAPGGWRRSPGRAARARAAGRAGSRRRPVLGGQGGGRGRRRAEALADRGRRSSPRPRPPSRLSRAAGLCAGGGGQQGRRLLEQRRHQRRPGRRRPTAGRTAGGPLLRPRSSTIQPRGAAGGRIDAGHRLPQLLAAAPSGAGT